MARRSVVALATQLLLGISSANYAIQDSYTADNFFDGFEFFTAPDPTHGFVNYVDRGTAAAQGLINTNNNAVYMGVDSGNVVSSGRNSVRITSNKVYNHGLIILDLAHMPTGCGTWPAFWTVGPSWPNSGEIDIIEGVHLDTNNAMTLHTTPGCTITNNNNFTGSITTDNCDVAAFGQAQNAGCTIKTYEPNTYGAGLNSINGGVYATEWTSASINVWFFPRYSIPSDISSGNPNPSSWGEPTAQFQGGCDIDSKIRDQQIVFDTTFCGDWAGNTWSSSSCASRANTCEEFVANNPGAFQEAFWTINSLKVYQDTGNNDVPSVAPTSTAAGPTGIAPGLPSALSSLAPVPVVTPPPAPAPTVVPLGQLGGWTSNPLQQAQASNPPPAAPPAPSPTPVDEPPYVAVAPSPEPGAPEDVVVTVWETQLAATTVVQQLYETVVHQAFPRATAASIAKRGEPAPELDARAAEFVHTLLQEWFPSGEQHIPATAAKRGIAVEIMTVLQEYFPDGAAPEMAKRSAEAAESVRTLLQEWFPGAGRGGIPARRLRARGAYTVDADGEATVLAQRIEEYVAKRAPAPAAPAPVPLAASWFPSGAQAIPAGDAALGKRTAPLLAEWFPSGGAGGIPAGAPASPGVVGRLLRSRHARGVLEAVRGAIAGEQ